MIVSLIAAISEVPAPLTWLGAGLLGVAAARWLPWPGVPLALVITLIAWTIWSTTLVDFGRPLGFLMPYVISTQDAFGLETSSPFGEPGWHAVYLFGLCLLALAAAGAVMSTRSPHAMAGRPKRPSLWARQGVTMATRMLPRGPTRDRYQQEFIAELYAMAPRTQAAYTLCVINHAWALRAAIIRRVPPGIGAHHARTSALAMPHEHAPCLAQPHH